MTVPLTDLPAGVSGFDDGRPVVVGWNGAGLEQTATLYCDAATTSPVAQQNGSLLHPYASLQSAIDAIGAPTDAADQKVRWTLLVGPGTYDEDLTIPAGRRIVILPRGPVTLGDGAVDSDFVSTTPRNINIDTTPAFGGRGVFVIGSSIPSSVYGARCTQATAFDISGDLVLTGTPTSALAHTTRLAMTRIRGNFDASAVTALGVDTHYFGVWLDGNLLGAGVPGTGVVAIIDAVRSAFRGTVSLLTLVHAENCAFEDDVTITAVPTVASLAVLPAGFYCCAFRNGLTFTGPATTPFLDAASNYWFKTNGCALGGTASKTIIGDLTP